MEEGCKCIFCWSFASGVSPKARLVRGVSPKASRSRVGARLVVAPDGVLFVINDTEPGQADAAALAKRRADLPPLKNVNQLLGWLPGPHGDRGMANDWQPLHKVKWAERDGEYIPLVGSAANALKIFNRHCGTSHIMNSSFRNMLSGCRPFEGGWVKMPSGQTPAAAGRSHGWL